MASRLWPRKVPLALVAILFGLITAEQAFGVGIERQRRLDDAVVEVGDQGLRSSEVGPLMPISAPARL
jgi:hypothetical protein